MPGDISRRALVLLAAPLSMTRTARAAKLESTTSSYARGASLDVFDGNTDTQKFQDALEKRCPALFLPARTIRITEQLEPKAPINLIGSGRNACDLFFDLNAFGVKISHSGRQLSLSGGIGVRGNPSFEHCGGFDLFDNAGAPIEDILASNFPRELVRLRQGVGCRLSNITTSAVGRANMSAAVYIDPGAESSVGITLDNVTIYGANIGVLAGTTRLLSMRNLIVQDSKYGVWLENCDGSYELHSENNVVDVRLVDCQGLSRSFLSAPNSDARVSPVTEIMWTKGSDPSFQRVPVKNVWFGGMVRSMPQIAPATGEWVDVLFSERLETFGVNPIPGGIGYGVLRFCQPGLYKINYAASFYNVGNLLQRAAARVTRSDGCIVDEVRGSARAASVRPEESIELSAETVVEIREADEEIALQFSVSDPSLQLSGDPRGLAEVTWPNFAQLSVMFLGVE